MGLRCVDKGLQAQPSMPNKGAVQRWQEASPCTKREWCVPLSLVVLDRPCAIEADNNTDQTEYTPATDVTMNE